MWQYLTVIMLIQGVGGHLLFLFFKCHWAKLGTTSDKCYIRVIWSYIYHHKEYEVTFHPTPSYFNEIILDYIIINLPGLERRIPHHCNRVDIRTLWRLLRCWGPTKMLTCPPIPERGKREPVASSNIIGCNANEEVVKYIEH